MATLQNNFTFSPLNHSEKNWATGKMKEITNHSAWHGKINELDSERYLSGLAPFTFLLRSGKDSHHYFISYVTPQLSVVHVPLSIEFSLKGWLYRNGGGRIRETLDELIVCALYCHALDCKPLKNLKADFYFSA